MDSSKTYYEVLGVPVDATPGQISTKYKGLLSAAKSSATANPITPDFLTKIRQAHVVLTDVNKRAAYDVSLAEEEEISQRIPASIIRKRNFFARVWRGEVRAWKFFLVSVYSSLRRRIIPCHRPWRCISMALRF